MHVQVERWEQCGQLGESVLPRLERSKHRAIECGLARGGVRDAGQPRAIIVAEDVPLVGDVLVSGYYGRRAEPARGFVFQRAIDLLGSIAGERLSAQCAVLVPLCFCELYPERFDAFIGAGLPSVLLAWDNELLSALNAIVFPVPAARSS